MRMRRKKYLNERLAALKNIAVIESDTFYDKPIKERENKLDYQKIFGNANGVELEIGCGKGGFITKLATKNSDKNYFAVEVLSNVIVAAAELADKMQIKNLSFINVNAGNLLYFLTENSIDNIYLNFSCPYPKKTYANRRLTNVRFLELYKKLLKNGGMIFQKTDDKDFFEYSIEQFKSAGFKLKDVTFDLHKEESKDNVITEYEEKFIKEGKPICRLVAYL